MRSEHKLRDRTQKNKLSPGHEEDSRNQIYEHWGPVGETKRIEPHSPSSYVLKRVSMWENMTLEELIDDLGKFDGTSRELFLNTKKMILINASYFVERIWLVFPER